jgi:hypothetical protein
MDPSSFSIEFQQGKEMGFGGFVVVCEWTRRCREEEKIEPACSRARALQIRFSRGLVPDRLLVGGESRRV